MATSLCVKCHNEIQYTLPTKTKFILCQRCGWGQYPASFWHSYWSGGYPGLSVLQNLSRWSRHLQDTAFLPILWTNKSAHRAICEHAERGSILTLATLCQQHEHSNSHASLFMLSKKLGGNFPVFM